MANAFKKINLFFSNKVFLGSFNDIEKMPENKSVEICLLGRSNVGKSSMINSVLKSKKLSRISKTPGRTRTINLYNVNKKINIVDLPGYGYAKLSKKNREELAYITELYISKRINLIEVLILIDCKVGIKNTDIDMFDLIVSYDKNFSIILNKIDKCSKGFIKKQIMYIESLMKNYNKNYNKIFMISNKKQEGILDIQKYIFNLSINNEI